MENDVVAASVLSGNRNFEARVHQRVKANFLMSPPLVVAFAIAGRVDVDLETEPLGLGEDGKPVFLREIWPTAAEIDALRPAAADAEGLPQLLLRRLRRENARGTSCRSAAGQGVRVGSGVHLHPGAAVLRRRSRPPRGRPRTSPRPARSRSSATRSPPTTSARPAPSSPRRPPALPPVARRRRSRLQQLRRAPRQPSRHGARHVRERSHQEPHGPRRRGRRHDSPAPGGGSRSTTRRSVPRARACRSRSSPARSTGRAARATGRRRARLLGVRFVVARSFERIHRSNLVGMGVLPCQFPEGVSAQSLGLDGSETYDLVGVSGKITARQKARLVLHRKDGRTDEVEVQVRIDTPIEAEYHRHGGIMQYVLRQILARA